MQFQPVCVVLRQVRLDFGDELGVVRTVRIEPKHRRVSGGAGAGDGKLDPVLNGRVFHLAHAEHIALTHGLAHEHVPVGVDHVNAARGSHLERLVVRSVLLGFLGHESHVGHTAHGGGV